MPLLSPGTLYKSVPKKFADNLDWRAHILKRCDSSRRFRQAQIDICKHDYLYRINTFVWQHNPDAEGDEMNVGPFITYKFQDRAFRAILDAIQDRRDLCIEKSRDMGASWMCVLALESIWNSLSDQNLAFVSRDLDSVSDPTSNSLFGKIEFYHRRMPEWLVPECKKLKSIFINESNGSKILAEAGTGKALVGYRVYVVLVDEYSQIGSADDVDGFTADATKCRIFNFTHTGIDTAAYRLTERPGVRKLVMHWSEHPEKAKGLYRSGQTINDVEILDKKYHYSDIFDFVLGGEPGGKFPGLRSPWYDGECLRRASKQYVAMNLDIDPKGSSDQFFDSLVIRQLKLAYAREPEWVGDIKYDWRNGEPEKLEARKGGLVKLWMHPEHDGSVSPAPYVISADVGEGKGRTPSCITVANAKTWKKVLEYVNAFIEPKDLAYLFVALAKLFKDESGSGAYAVWECPGPGENLGRQVIELGYRHFYYDKPKNKSIFERATDKPGFYASSVNKRWLFEEYRSALQGKRFHNPSAEALEECLAFKYEKNTVVHPHELNKNNPSEGGVNHGDRAVTDALALMLCMELNDGPQAEERKKLEEDKAPYMSMAWRREQSKKAESNGRSTLRV